MDATPACRVPWHTLHTSPGMRLRTPRSADDLGLGSRDGERADRSGRRVQMEQRPRRVGDGRGAARARDPRCPTLTVKCPGPRAKPSPVALRRASFRVQTHRNARSRAGIGDAEERLVLLPGEPAAGQRLQIGDRAERLDVDAHVPTVSDGVQGEPTRMGEIEADPGLARTQIEVRLAPGTGLEREVRRGPVEVLPEDLAQGAAPHDEPVPRPDPPDAGGARQFLSREKAAQAADLLGRGRPARRGTPVPFR